MKLLSFFLLAVLPFASAKTNLRQHGSIVVIEEDYSNLTPRAAPAEYRHSRRRLNADCINAGVAALLPALNSAIQSSIPDPVPVTGATYSQTYTVSGTCGGSTITATTVFQEFSGTSSLAIQSLTVDDATDEFTCGCPTSTFKGEFDYVIGADTLAATGTTTLSSTGCMADSSSPYSGTVTNPRFNGRVYIEGSITGNTATVDNYEIRSITASCDATSIDYTTGFSSDYAGLTSTNQINTDAATELKNQVSAQLNTVVTDALNMALANAFAPGIDLGFGGGLPIIAGFYRAAAEERVTGWRDQAQGMFTGAQTMVDGWLSNSESFIGQYGFQVTPIEGV